MSLQSSLQHRRAAGATRALALGALLAHPSAAHPSAAHPSAARAPTRRPRPAFAKDRVLLRLEKMLPPGWRLRRRSRTFVIESSTPIWVLHANTVNAPPGAGARLRARWLRVRRRTPPTHAALTFRYEPRWSPARIARVLRHNRGIAARIQKIARQVARAHGRWKRGADALRRRTAALRQRLLPVPFLTPRHAVFLVSERGLESAFVHVFPERAAREAFRVHQRVMALLRPYRAAGSPRPR